VRGPRDSKSAAVRAAAVAPSRRQLSKWEREQRQQRLLFVAAGGLVLLIALIFGGGYVYDTFVRGNQTLAQVGPDTITANQLVEEVRPSARQIDTQARQRGGGVGVAQYVEGQKRQLPDPILNDLIDARLIEQEANRRGLRVAPSEVDDRMQQVVAAYASVSTPTAVPMVDASATPPSGTPTPLPTLEPSAYNDGLKKLLDETSLTEREERQEIERNLLREKVQQAIGQEQVPANQEQVHARKIVVATEDQARDVRGQVLGGGDFAELAQQVSTDSATRAKGGDLGWFARGVQPKTIEDAAFALEPGQLSDVVSNGDSFQVIQVVEREPDRPVAADQLTTLRNQAFNTWLSQRRASPDVRLSFGSADKDWILSKIGVRP
jgi:hypothetical protein